jgi:hypothetical protein
MYKYFGDIALADMDERKRVKRWWRKIIFFNSRVN